MGAGELHRASRGEENTFPGELTGAHLNGTSTTLSGEENDLVCIRRQVEAIALSNNRSASRESLLADGAKRRLNTLVKASTAIGSN